MNPIFTKRCNTNKSQCTGKRDLSSSFKKKCIRKSIYAYFSLSIDASPFLHSEEVEGRKERKERGCLATGILHQTKKKKRGRKNLLQQRQRLRKEGEIPAKLRELILPLPHKKSPEPGRGEQRGQRPPLLSQPSPPGCGCTRAPLPPRNGTDREPAPGGIGGYFKSVPYSIPSLFHSTTAPESGWTGTRRPAPQPRPSPALAAPLRLRSPLAAPGAPPDPSPAVLQPLRRRSHGTSSAPLLTPRPPELRGHLASASAAAPHRSPRPPSLPACLPPALPARPPAPASGSLRPEPEVSLRRRSGMAARLERGGAAAKPLQDSRPARARDAAAGAAEPSVRRGGERASSLARSGNKGVPEGC